MHHHSYQFVHGVRGGLGVSRRHSQFEGEGDLPYEFGDAAFVLVILEPAEVD